MNILNWIASNPAIAFWITCAMLIISVMLFAFIVDIIRAITGNYPPSAYCESCCEEYSRDDDSEDDI